MTADTLLRPPLEAAENRPEEPDRRLDIDTKAAQVPALLQETGCEGLLLLEPENFAWLTSGATDRGLFDPGSSPAVDCNGDARWLIAQNVDAQRFFDEEMDGLGFQLKEWPWHWSRDQYLAELCQSRKVACDRPLADTKLVADNLRRLRRPLTSYEQACLRALGGILSHALEATCRTLAVNETEREVAGQLAHRLMHRGAQPQHIGVAADGRARTYRNPSFTSVPIQKYALLTATACKYGLAATASRAVCFGPPDAELRKEQNAVCRIGACYLASTWPGGVPRQLLSAARRIYDLSGYEHEWRLAPQGYITGRLPVELLLTPTTEELFQVGWAVTWNASVGAARSCDTFLITNEGPKAMTDVEAWPVKRIKIQGTELVRPDILQR